MSSCRNAEINVHCRLEYFIVQSWAQATVGINTKQSIHDIRDELKKTLHTMIHAQYLSDVQLLSLKIDNRDLYKCM